MTLQLPIRWRRGTERPDSDDPAAAVIAAQDVDGQLYLLGIYCWQLIDDGRYGWINEDTGEPLNTDRGPWWWALETDLLATVA